MKKIKIILPILAAVLAVAYFVCSLVIPEQTVWFMEQVGVVLNYPITIAGVSMTIGGIIAWILANFILKNTKFGRKELTNMTADNDSLKNELLEYKNDIDEKVEKCLDECYNFKQDCEARVEIMINQFELLQNNMLSALKTIPNKKVQEIVNKYEAEYETKKAEFIEKAVNSDKYIEEKLTNMFNQFMIEVEEKLNEREETVNIETEEE